MSNKASSGPALKPIGVFVLDDHEIVRGGIRGLLEAEPDIRVIGEASTASAALASIPALYPDVAVLGVRLPDGDGVSVCREIRGRGGGRWSVLAGTWVPWGPTRLARKVLCHD